jgi:hypothetical protein
MGRASRRKRDRREPTISLPHTPEVPFSLYEAARVSRFMDEDELGRWQLSHFEIKEADYNEKMRRIYFTSEHPDEEMARAVPPGDYIVLRRRMPRRHFARALRDPDAARGALDSRHV